MKRILLAAVAVIVSAAVNAQQALPIGPVSSPPLTYSVNAKDYATGNTVQFADGAITSATSVLASAAATFAAGDVGKQILVHGSGAAGIAQQGTITGVTDSHHITVSFVASTTVSGAKYIYGTDDTQGVTNAFSYASSVGACVTFPYGSYWLATQAAPISLSYTCMKGVGSTEYYAPYVGRGSTLVVTQTGVSPFTVGPGVDIEGMIFFWPAQDASAATPIAYPPLFDGSSWANDTFVNNVFVNPYILWKVDQNGAMGRVTFSNNKAYCVLYCGQMLAGNPDYLSFDASNQFTPGIYEDYAIYTNGGVLSAWTGDNGEFIHFDATGSSLTALSVTMNGGLVYGYRYGIRLVNTGSLQVSTISNVAWDGVATILSFSGATYPATVNINGGYVYSYRGRAADAASSADSVIEVLSTCTGGTISSGTLLINGMEFANSKGGVLNFQTNCLKGFSAKANDFRNWGQSTTNAAYYAIASTGAPLDVVGNTFKSNAVGGSFMQCVLTYSGGKLSNNKFDGCNNSLVWLGATVLDFGGNTAVNSTAVPISGTGTALQEHDNYWDVNPTPPTVSSCGTSPTLTAGASDRRGFVTTGSGTVTSCTVIFAYAMAKAPICMITQSGGNSAQLNAGSPPTTTALTVAFPASAPGTLFGYNCPP